MTEPQRCVHVNLDERSYPIQIGRGLLAHAGSLIHARCSPSRVVIVSDDRVAALHGAALHAGLNADGLDAECLTFPAGETSKTLPTISTLLDSLFALGLDRKSLVIALGGGVTGDMAGFVAAIYQRGIPFVQIPTSLLAMVDSSSGGKTGVNHPSGKNMIGAFHQPSLVLIDTDVLQTLPIEELRNGLAEVVKHGVIRDAAYFNRVETKAQDLLALDAEALAEIIEGSCRIKAGIVADDERETGCRALLNLGHTFGHAYETLSHYAIRHGEAVAMGMIAAAHLAERLLDAPPSIRARITGLLTALGLPTASPDYAPSDVLALMRSDKKAEHNALRLVLPETIGAARVMPITDEDAVLDAIRATQQR